MTTIARLARSSADIVFSTRDVPLARPKCCFTLAEGVCDGSIPRLAIEMVADALERGFTGQARRLASAFCRPDLARSRRGA